MVETETPVALLNSDAQFVDGRTKGKAEPTLIDFFTHRNSQWRLAHGDCII